MAILAIDPSSPVSGGSILGDRIRMDRIADLPGLFIRSLSSRGARNGLCDNIVDFWWRWNVTPSTRSCSKPWAPDSPRWRSPRWSTRLC